MLTLYVGIFSVIFSASGETWNKDKKQNTFIDVLYFEIKVTDDESSTSYYINVNFTCALII